MTLPVEDPVLIFALTMSIVLLAPMLFKRVGMPGLVGLIVVGAIVGPNAIGLLARDATFELLGTVGLLYLMFTAGLSIDFDQFTRLRGRSVTFGLFSFTLPFVVALGAGLALLGFGWSATLLLGAIVGSHTLLAYPIAQRLKLDKSPAVVMTMGGTVVTDLVSLLLLAVVTQVAAGKAETSDWMWFAARVALFGVAATWGVQLLGRWFFRTVKQQPDVQFAFLLTVVFGAAFVAEQAGLAAIIGAFVVGLSLNRLVPEQSPMMTRILFVGEALFVPFFLLSVGMLVDLRALLQLPLWALAILLSSLVLGGKAAAAFVVGKIYGYSRDEQWTIYGLSSPQAAATLAVTLIGFEIGLFNEQMVNGVVVMMLVTCLVGPFVVERWGRRMALAAESAPSTEPPPQRILVALSNPETAEELTDLALLIHDPSSTVPIYPMTVVRDGPGSDGRVAQAEDMLGRAVLHAAAADVEMKPLTRLDHNPASGIVRATKEERISTVLIGWNGENTARSFIFGSVLDQLLGETREMLWVCRLAQPLATTQRILALVPPYLSRETGFAAAMRAVKILARQAGAELVLIAAERSSDELEATSLRIKPDTPLRVEQMDSWTDTITTLDELYKSGDLLILLTSREGSLAWRPALDRLPRVLAQRFSDAGLLIVYPADVPLRTLVGPPSGSGARALGRAIAPEFVQTGLTADTDEETMLRALLQPLAEMGYVETNAILDRLRAGGTDYAVELRPGVAFYHAHTSLARSTHVLVGTSKDGLHLPASSGPVHVVLIFLCPRSVGSSRYLSKLSSVAHLVQSEEQIDALVAADEAEDVAALLLAALQEPE